MPLISVIIPTKNRANLLRDALDSVLRQSYRDFNIVVIDDGSTDETSSVLENLSFSRLVTIRNLPSVGIARSLNLALSMTDSKYIARLDSDDLMHVDRLARQVKKLESDHRVGVVGSWAHFFGFKNFLWKSPTSHGAITLRMCFENAIAHPSVMIRREALDFGQTIYRPEYNHLEDWDLWERISQSWELANIPAALTQIRLHREQSSRESGLEVRELENEVRARFRKRVLLSHKSPGLELSDEAFAGFMLSKLKRFEPSTVRTIFLGLPPNVLVASIPSRISLTIRFFGQLLRLIGRRM